MRVEPLCQRTAASEAEGSQPVYTEDDILLCCGFHATRTSSEGVSHLISSVNTGTYAMHIVDKPDAQYTLFLNLRTATSVKSRPCG